VDTERKSTPKIARSDQKRALRFSASLLGSLPAGTYTDPASVGLQFRVTDRAGSSAPSRSWLLRFKFRGQESRILLGHFPSLTLADARRAAIELRDRAAQGIDPRRATNRRVSMRDGLTSLGAPYTVTALVASFLENHIRPRLKRPEKVEDMLRRDVLPAWGERDARTIEPIEVIELLDAVVKRGSPIAANRLASVLGQMFKYGIHRRIVSSSPVQLLFRPGGPERGRSRVLSDDELRMIVTDPQQSFRLERTAHAVMVLLLTGQRRGELCLATWRDIDFKKKIWRIPAENSKNGREHIVPLSTAVLERLSALKGLADRSKFVLPNEKGDGPIDAKYLTRSVARCASRLKRRRIEKFTLHDLRRTCRTGLSRLGVRPDIAELTLNHSRGRLIETYDRHDHLEERREALEKWARHVASLADDE
jgi:integrase